MTPALRINRSLPVTAQHRRHQPGLKAVQLGAGVAQARHFNHSRCADVQTCSGWQGQQVNAGGGDVLAEIAGPHREIGGHQFLEQLGVQQVHLPQIRLARIAGDA